MKVKEFFWSSRIEFKRGGGWLLAAIVFTFTLFSQLHDILYNGAYGSWYIVSATSNALVGLYPFVAGLAAWTGMRARRLGIAEYDASIKGFGLQRTLQELFVFAIWVTLTISILFAFVIFLGAQRIEGGDLPFSILIVTTLAMLAAASLGYVFGYFMVYTFTPLLSMGFVYVFLELPHHLDRYSGANGLLPVRIGSLIYPGPWEQSYLRLAIISGFWFGCICVLVPIVLWVAKSRSKLSAFALVSFSILLIGSAFGSYATAEESQEWHANNRDLVCVEHNQYSFCSVTSYPLEKLNNEADQMIRLLSPLSGLANVPTRYYTSALGIPPSGSGIWFSASSEQTFDLQITRTALRLVDMDAGEGKPSSASQMAVACWIVQVAGYDCQIEPAGTFEGQSLLALHDLASMTTTEQQDLTNQLDALNSEIMAKANNLLLKSSSDQRNWISENWAQIQDGSLSLEAMP